VLSERLSGGGGLHFFDVPVIEGLYYYMTASDHYTVTTVTVGY
jgi:hypothetical protein